LTIKFNATIPFIAYSFDALIKISNTKVNNDKYIYKFESIDLSGHPTTEGTKRIRIKRIVVLNRINKT
jgi:hypothetical protein